MRWKIVCIGVCAVAMACGAEVPLEGVLVPAVKATPQTAGWAAEWWPRRHEQKVKLAAAGDFDLLLIGDSITHHWEDHAESKEVWGRHFGHISTLNLGFSGDRTEHVLWRLRHGEVPRIHPQVAVLLIGANNTIWMRKDPAEHTAQGIRAILNELREQLPDTKILLLGVLPIGATPDNPQRQVNNELNRIIGKYADDRHVFFLNMSKAMLDEEGNLLPGIIPDMIHPNAAGYEIWAQQMKPMVTRLLGE